MVLSLARRGIFLLCLVVAGFSLLPADALAQGGGEELLSNEACRADPNDEDCICRNVRIYERSPEGEILVSPNGIISAVGSSSDELLRYHADSRTWSGGTDDDYRYETDKYKALCSLAYFQENSKRLIYVVIAMGAGLTAISIAWGGFVHMQEAASGESRSTSRTIILRCVMGMLLLAVVFLSWEAYSGVFLGDLEIWDSAPGFLEGF